MRRPGAAADEVEAAIAAAIAAGDAIEIDTGFISSV
jgi:hypothetical protein